MPFTVWRHSPAGEQAIAETLAEWHRLLAGLGVCLSLKCLTSRCVGSQCVGTACRQASVCLPLSNVSHLGVSAPPAGGLRCCSLSHIGTAHGLHDAGWLRLHVELGAPHEFCVVSCSRD